MCSRFPWGEPERATPDLDVLVTRYGGGVGNGCENLKSFVLIKQIIGFLVTKIGMTEGRAGFSRRHVPFWI